MIDKENARQTEDRMIASAYAFWIQGGTEKSTFDGYLRSLGLAKSKKPVSKAVKQKIAAKAHSVAKRIMAMDKKRK
jgi:hypothetical protein